MLVHQRVFLRCEGMASTSLQPVQGAERSGVKESYPLSIPAEGFIVIIPMPISHWNPTIHGYPMISSPQKSFAKKAWNPMGNPIKASWIPKLHSPALRYGYVGYPKIVLLNGNMVINHRIGFWCTLCSDKLIHHPLNHVPIEMVISWYPLFSDKPPENLVDRQNGIS